ncbi:hypothetical protein WJX84_000922 [Apatococcus fuscideae]|uniref:Uncharacterized protein n=1 Tax=Apatococcus fuscideae TaxID=2026836 RepID=A0AAW1TB89_9CHLO
MVDAYSTQAQQAVRGASRDVPRRVRSRLKRALAPLSVADDAPIYLRDNQFIRDYYRVNFSTKDTWRSLFRIHNETGNIWSHLVGFLIFAWLTLHALLARPAPLALAQLKLTELEQNLQQHDCSLGDLWQPGRPHFNFGKEPEEASKCLENRLNQQFGNSKHIGKLMWRLDYAGITILIVTSFFPPVYYGFMCRPFWRNVYLGITTVVGLATVWTTLSSRFQQEAWRPFRAGLFSVVGGWGFIPITHGWFIGHEHLPIKQMLLLDVIMGFIYLGGAAIYAAQIPESRLVRDPVQSW